MRICLFEDRRVADLAPLTLTRPAFDLLCGLSPVADQHARHFAPDAVGYLVRPLVADLAREAHPHAPVNDPVWLRAGATVLVNARWVPPAGACPRGLLAGGPVLAVCDGELAFAAVTPELLAGVFPNTLDDALDDWLGAMPRQEVGGFVARRPADYLDHNAAQITAGFVGQFDPEFLGLRPTNVALVGPAGRLFLDPTSAVDPMVALDTTGGPVVVGPGALVKAFTRLEGPCAIGAGAVVLGARVGAGTTVGPYSRVGGEVSASILQGFVEKPHAGVLARGYVGEWAALGAGVQAADGCVLGDHSTVEAGTLLANGAVVGAFASVLPTGRAAPRDVPSFAQAGPDGLAVAQQLDAHLAAADAAMRRRGRQLTPAREAVYRAAAAQTAAHRRRVVTGDDRQRRAG